MTAVCKLHTEEAERLSVSAFLKTPSVSSRHSPSLYIIYIQRTFPRLGVAMITDRAADHHFYRLNQHPFNLLLVSALRLKRSSKNAETNQRRKAHEDSTVDR